MRIAVVSDIHGNLAAFEAVLNDLTRTRPDLVVHGGDLVLNGSSPAAVIDIIRDLGWPGVVGNTDELLWRPERLSDLEKRTPERSGLRRALFTQMGPVTRDTLGSDRIEWLKTLPLTWSNETTAVVHATPLDLWRAPLADASDEELTSTYSSLARPQVCYAHIHRGYIRALGELTIANTGSVSLSYDGDPRASYLLIDNGAMSLRRVEYDIGRETRALRQQRYPNADWLIAILETGNYTRLTSI